MADVTPQRGKSPYRQHMDEIMSLHEKMHAPTVSVMLEFNRRNIFANYAEYLEWVRLSSSVESRVWGSDREEDGSTRLAARQAEEGAQRCLQKFRLKQ